MHWKRCSHHLDSTFEAQPFCVEFIAVMHWKRQSPHTGPSVLLAKCRITFGNPLQDTVSSGFLYQNHNYSAETVADANAQEHIRLCLQTHCGSKNQRRKLHIMLQKNLPRTEKKYALKASSKGKLKQKWEAPKTRKITPNLLQNRISVFDVQPSLRAKGLPRARENRNFSFWRPTLTSCEKVARDKRKSHFDVRPFHFARKGCCGPVKSVFDVRPSFCAKGLRVTIENRIWRPTLISCEKVAANPRILRKFLTSDPHFVRKGCHEPLKIAILRQFLTSDPHFVRKGSCGPVKIAILHHQLRPTFISCERVAIDASLYGTAPP